MPHHRHILKVHRSKQYSHMLIRKHHRGGNLFTSILNFFKPVASVLKPVASTVKNVITDKQLMKHIADTTGNIVNIGKNTKSIVDSIRNKPSASVKDVVEEVARAVPTISPDIQDIIDRINKLKAGTGTRRRDRLPTLTSSLRHRGKGFAYV